MNKRPGFTLLEVALSLPLLLLVLWNTNRIAEAIASGIEQQREAPNTSQANLTTGWFQCCFQNPTMNCGKSVLINSN